MDQHAYGRRAADKPPVVWPNLTETIYTWLKIIGALAAIIGLVVAITQTIDNHDKRLTALEIAGAQQAAVVSGNSNRIGTIENWIPLADFKFNLLLEHFGIPVPKEIK